MIIFAMTLTVLIAILGLAIDTVRIFDLYARMERAAEAGALAGVIYLPNNYNTPLTGTPNNDSAVSRASREIVKNGFGKVLSNNDKTIADYCPSNIQTVEIAICLVAGQDDELKVTVTETTNVILLSAIGVGPATISASGVASYLPMIQLGSRSNTFGDQVECYNGRSRAQTSSCSINDTSRTHVDYYTASINGPADLIESGDPYVYCAEGPTDVGSAGGLDPISVGNTYNGYATNHPQWPDVSTSPGYTGGIAKYCGPPGANGANPGNPNQQATGFSGPMTANTAHPGGYNYQINIASGNTGSLWIYNPNYIPGPNWSNAPTILGNPDLDRFVDSNVSNFYQGPQGEGIGNNFKPIHPTFLCYFFPSRCDAHDAPLFYYNVTYTLYQVTNVYNRATDVQLASTTYAPYDGEYVDLAAHGCNAGSQLYDPFWNGANTVNEYFNAGGIQPGQGCVTAATINSRQGCNPQDWCKLSVPGGLAAGTYRLVVEATGLTAKTSAYNSTSLDGWGSHDYALKVCTSNTITSPVGNQCMTGAGNSSPATIAGWNNDDVILQGTLTNARPSANNPQTSCVTSNWLPYACFDLACIPSNYAGRSLTISIFDPGDAAGTLGNLYLGIVPPDATTATITYPPGSLQASIDGENTVQTLGLGQRYYNGLWLTANVTLSPSYTGSCDASGSGWWQVLYASGNNVQPTDKIAVKISVVGSPVHLGLAG